jgi:hypothetical protein
VNRDLRPAAAYRQRGWQPDLEAEDFNAPETWHPAREKSRIRYIQQAAGQGFRHAVTVADVRERLSLLPQKYTRNLKVVQFSGMTRKRQLFPCYGMQWGASVYLYPMEESLVEIYRHPPTPQQQIEARMFGGRWSNDGKLWRLTWTEQTIKDFYLTDVISRRYLSCNKYADLVLRRWQDVAPLTRRETQIFNLRQKYYPLADTVNS